MVPIHRTFTFSMLERFLEQQKTSHAYAGECKIWKADVILTSTHWNPLARLASIRTMTFELASGRAPIIGQLQSHVLPLIFVPLTEKGKETIKKREFWGMVISYLVICFSTCPSMQTQTLAKTPPVSRWTQGKYKAHGMSDFRCRGMISLARFRFKCLKQ